MEHMYRDLNAERRVRYLYIRDGGHLIFSVYRSHRQVGQTQSWCVGRHISGFALAGQRGYGD